MGAQDIRIAQLRERAAAEPAVADNGLLVAFVDAAFDGVSARLARDRSFDGLYAAVLEQFRLVCAARRRGAAVVAIHAIDARGRDCDTALATVTDDMPFLVDTVSMAVRAAGADIDWSLHPVIRVIRDPRGAATGFRSAAVAADRGDEESTIRLEFAAPAGLDTVALVDRVRAALADVEVVVADWQPMRRRLQHVVSDLAAPPAGADREDCAETAAFLRWLADDRFTFLGYRCRAIENANGQQIMVDVADSSLGLLREDRPAIDPDGYVAAAATLDKYTGSARMGVVAKANARAWIHHAETMDVIAVKRLDAAGNVIGAHRFLGLFSSEAYAESPRSIPLLARKTRDVITRAALRPQSHAAKSLRYILETFPRDELFQATEAELYDTAMAVLSMRETERLRLFVRRDRYERFFSCIVYMPRERYNVELRARIGAELQRRLSGQFQESDARFLRGALVRVHYQIAVDARGARDIDAAALEGELIAATRAWPDRFAAAARAVGLRMPAYARAFDSGYRGRFDAAQAVEDARVLASLGDADPPVLHVTGLTAAGDVALKVYGAGTAMTLSAVLPILENFGLSVHTQRPYMVQRPGEPAQWIHEYEAAHPRAATLAERARGEAVAAVFAAIVAGAAENDRLNRLVIDAGFSPRQVVLVRTITRYLLQTELPFSPVYIQQQLAAHAELVAHMVARFQRRFDPMRDQLGDTAEHAAADAIGARLDAVASLDADRVLRAFYGVVESALRTNYYQRDANGHAKAYVSIKLDATRVPELPEPRPMFEAFVYAPAVEGVHLRGGRVARGGLRWSDRREDFRTEVLGLMKAQMVKNAVIVPVGAKGGFVVKNAAPDESHPARQARGIACYQTFIRGLLDITDNRVDGAIVAPANVLRYDGDDPYLVVAADKGTARFSDIANALAREYGFWLDDAFASGGSAGYDHKAMGITARGAWEAVKRHFREMGRDIQREALTAVGIGDMGGDVFGNGMLLSEQIVLVAAFNHRHIFIDPDPDPAASFAERKRLFEGSSSGWQAYDSALISAGGGVYERSAKHIDLSAPARAALGIQARRLTPNALIRAVLAAPVDLLWNGGIGTYVKARHESAAEVGDRGNDALRVDGADLRAKVVGEGGNLGLTQAGRVEYALAGGRCNTDAIDNSGGVDCSDLEVNIKIALGAAEAAGTLDRAQRDAVLAQMTDGVIARVLRTNYLQTQQISLMATDTAARLDERVSFMRSLERDGFLDRRLERLPDDETVAERARNRQGLTRPETAVIVSYSKIALADAVLASDLADDPWLDGVLAAGFPAELPARFPEAVAAHGLRRELVTALLTNQMVDRLGITTAHRLPAGFGARRHAAVRAYVLADAWLDGEALFERIDALDNIVPSETQYAAHKIVTALVKQAMGWVLAAPGSDGDLATLVGRYRPGAREMLAALPEYVVGAYKSYWDTAKARWQARGLHSSLADNIASADLGGGIMDIVSLAHAYARPVGEVAGIYFELGDALGVVWLQAAIHAMPAPGRWTALARASLRGDSYRIHHRLVEQVLDIDGDDPLAQWRGAHARTLAFIGARLAELQAIERPGHEHLSVAVRDMSRLATPTPTRLGGAA